ncbi:MAG: metal ABC transporter permease [Paracoccaceae bacterium]
MLDDFLTRAALAGLGTALAAAPLGCFVVWRRMAYFGDATAHAAVLGVALALAFALPVAIGVVVAALAMALAVRALSGRGEASDTALGVLAHAALAAGLVAASFVPGLSLDLEAWLFGDILTVGRGDLAVIWGGALAVAGLMAWRWSALVTVTLSPDLARAAGLDPAREDRVLTLALALTVAVAIEVVGALLIGALLIVPAAAARRVSSTPEGMALAAGAVGAVSALGGLALSLAADTPSGPTIVTTATALFAASLGLGALRRA